jgi:hypothetical protein
MKAEGESGKAEGGSGRWEKIKSDVGREGIKNIRFE